MIRKLLAILMSVTLLFSAMPSFAEEIPVTPVIDIAALMGGYDPMPVEEFPAEPVQEFPEEPEEPVIPETPVIEIPETPVIEIPEIPETPEIEIPICHTIKLRKYGFSAILMCG